MCLFFFFFKQKTAYEMRISDWSSDVCSSDLAHIELGPRVTRENAVKLLRIIGWGLRGGLVDPRLRPRRERGEDLTRQRDGMGLRRRGIIGDPRDAGVHVGAAELVDAHHLAGRRLDERRPAEEDRAGSARSEEHT